MRFAYNNIRFSLNDYLRKRIQFHIGGKNVFYVKFIKKRKEKKNAISILFN